MVIDAEAALRAVSIVLESTEGKRTAMGSLQSCFLTAITTFAGSLAGGPRGIIPGALLGAALAYFVKKDTYKSLVDVVQEDLSPREKRELAGNVQRVISSFNVVDVAILCSMAANNENFQKEVLGCVHSFIETAVNNGHALAN